MEKVLDHRRSEILLDRETGIYRFSRTIIVVAREGYAGDWSAYIDSVPGRNHSEEWEKVYQDGTKISQEVAEVLFPEFAKKFRWRR